METMAEFGEDKDMNRKVYLPLLEDTDECRRRSSASLNDLACKAMLSINPARPQSLKMGYIANLVSEGAVSPCSLILSLFYIKRLSQMNPAYVRSVPSRDIFLTSLLVASKYMNDEGEDEALTNSQWAAAGYKEKEEVDLLEKRFLSAIDWRLYVSLQEYNPFVADIQKRIAIAQLKQRGWATYTDLATIWQASDVEETMLSASKQAAKVTCATSLVYLMCVATLFAASYSLRATRVANSDLSVDPGINLSVNSAIHNHGVCMVFGGQECGNSSVPPVMGKLYQSGELTKLHVHKTFWSTSHNYRQKTRTYQKFELFSSVDHQEEFKEVRNGMQDLHSPDWNGTRSYHSSRQNRTVYHSFPENKGDSLGQESYHPGKIHTSNNSMNNGEIAALRYHLSPTSKTGKEPREYIWTEWKFDAGQNDKTESKHGKSHQAHNIVGGNRSSLVVQTTAHVTTFPPPGSGDLSFLSQQQQKTENQSIPGRCAMREPVWSTEASPWLQTTLTSWPLA